MPTSADILAALSVIIDPDLGRDIVSLGFIKDLEITEQGAVSLSIELTTPACPVKEEFRARAEALLRALPGVQSVAIRMTAQKAQANARQSKGLARVRNIIAVSSCKGGVGKSTVAVNLACSLARTGASVGILDADIYGPSLPAMIHVEDSSIYQADGLMIPLEGEGLKLMSFGYLNPGEEAAIMRGPMVSQVIGQLLGGTDWGDLDYLVVDFPPGTGDIQLTLLQSVPFSAAVIVTTPQKLSFIDVVKGMKMFDTLKVPTVAVVENMAYVRCSHCGEADYVFGQGAKRRLVEMFGIRHALQIPVIRALSTAPDEGRPTVMTEPAGEVARLFSDLASSVAREIARLKHGTKARPVLTAEPDGNLSLSLDGGERLSLRALELRAACRCAACIHEFTGEQLLRLEDIPADIHATSIAPLGNYAISVVWSDGHSSSIYPYDVLVKLAR